MMMNWTALRGHFGGYLVINMVGDQEFLVQMEPDLIMMHISKTQHGIWVMTTVKWDGAVQLNHPLHGCQYSFWMQDLDAVAALLGLSPGNAAAALNNAVKPMWFDELYRTIQNNKSNVLEFQLKSDGEGDVNGLQVFLYG